MTSQTRLRLGQIALGLAAAAAVWALAVGIFGGVTLQVGGRQISSNNPTNPAIAAVALALAGWSVATGLQRRAFADRISSLVEHVPARTAPMIAAAAAVAVMALGFTKGAFYVGGADAYGYISQAELWAKGELRYPEPMLQEFDWPFSPRALAPLGYLPAADGQSMVPIYAPGFPMVLALLQVIGGRAAVFLAVPLLAALAVWCTYVMGRRLDGPLVGASAAVLLATSPTFLFHTLIMPMSDVPATAWWALALALSISQRRAAAFAAGLAVSLAVLTRPNLAHLAAFPLLLMCADGWRDRTRRQASLRRGLWFVAGVLPGVITIATLNTVQYGSPLTSGQLLVNPPFSLGNVPMNFSRYSQWLAYTQTPFVLLALAAPFVMHARGTQVRDDATPSARVVVWAWLGFIAVVFASYLVFMKVDAWFWLRYLMPAFPPLFVLMSGAMAGVLARFGPAIRSAGTAALIAWLASRGISVARGEHIFVMAPIEAKYEIVGRFVADHLPDRSVFVSMLYSGTIRYYAGRPIIQYGAIPPGAFDRVLDDLRRHGYRPYLVLEKSEEPWFLETFRGDPTVGTLDLPEIADLGHSSGVRIFDLGVRPPGARPNE